MLIKVNMRSKETERRMKIKLEHKRDSSDDKVHKKNNSEITRKANKNKCVKNCQGNKIWGMGKISEVGKLKYYSE